MKETNLTSKTLDIAAENIQNLKQLFPEVFTEDKIDFEKLKLVLGEHIETENERYNFTWNGKAEALQLSRQQSTGTLRPCKEESKDWDTTQNLYIEGDNLEILKLLQKSYHSKVKMIYIDPPYNTGKDFVYPDDYRDNVQNYLELTGQVDSDNRKMGTNTESNGRYHTDWLNMMYPRLRLARNLLADDGVIFISIDDNEQANLKKMCDEVFGEENFVGCFIWEKRKTRENRRQISVRHDYFVVYVKTDKDSEDVIGLIPMNNAALERYKNPDNDPRGSWTSVPAIAQAGHGTSSQFYDLMTPNGRLVTLQSGNCWRFTFDKMQKEIAANNIWFGADGNGVPRIKKFFNEGRQGLTAETMWFADDVGTNDSAKRSIFEIFDKQVPFDTPKPYTLIMQMLKLTSNSDSLVLDFFSGSATTAHAVMQLNAEDGGNRKFIMVQLPEPCDENSEAFKAGYKNICEIGKERIRRAGDKINAEIAVANSQPTLDGKQKQPVDIGFKVLKLANSNLKKWNARPENVEASLWDSVENFVEGRNELDVVYEIMIKYGLDLSYTVEEIVCGGKKIYSIGMDMLLICLDDELTTDIANYIVQLKKERAVEQMRVVFKDNGFKNDSVKTNVKEILKAAGVEEFVTV